nr:hypothetical protein GCM10017611_08750 [Rhodococcus wratislaviensis]
MELPAGDRSETDPTQDVGKAGRATASAEWTRTPAPGRQIVTASPRPQSPWPAACTVKHPGDGEALGVPSQGSSVVRRHTLRRGLVRLSVRTSEKGLRYKR